MMVVTPSRRCSPRISWRSDWRTRASRADKRLVEQEERRRGRERPGQRDALLLAARELRRVLVLVTGEPHERQQLVDTAGDGAGLHATRLEAVGDVPTDGQVREERVGLEDDAVVAQGRRQAGDVAAGHAHRARVLALEPSDDPQQRGLAAAGWTEEADEFAGADGERDVPQRDETR